VNQLRIGTRHLRERLAIDDVEYLPNLARGHSRSTIYPRVSVGFGKKGIPCTIGNYRRQFQYCVRVEGSRLEAMAKRGGKDIPDRALRQVTDVANDPSEPRPNTAVMDVVGGDMDALGLLKQVVTAAAAEKRSRASLAHKAFP
jgi:hypothetical protein